MTTSFNANKILLGCQYLVPNFDQGPEKVVFTTLKAKKVTRRVFWSGVMAVKRTPFTWDQNYCYSYIIAL